jgi:tRNA-Thr(GGU) m(6)t(6)A37 methyltransferase TsaA
MLMPAGSGHAAADAEDEMLDDSTTYGCPLPVIGVVHTARTDTDHTPVQAGINRSEVGTVVIDEAYADGLLGLTGFDYLWLLTWLHRPRVLAPAPLRQVPFLLRPTQQQVGVFAMRGPRRVNPIGLSLVRLHELDGATIRFGGVDLLDGTPVVDIKPYVGAFDGPAGDPRSGWFDAVAMRDGITPADLPPGAPPAGG